MAKFVPAFVASVQYAAGITVFKKPETTAGGPMLSCIMVLISVFLLLWSLPIYPRRLRKPIKVLNYITEYVIAVFYVETIMGLFWFPLEIAALSFLHLLGSSIEQTLRNYNIFYPTNYNFLQSDATKTFYSLLLSTTILLLTLDITRIINLGLLSAGLQPFSYDLLRRYRRFSNNFPKNIGFSKGFNNTSRSCAKVNSSNPSELGSEYEDERSEEEEW